MLLFDMFRLVRVVFHKRESPISFAPSGPMLLWDRFSVKEVDVFVVSDFAMEAAPEGPILAVYTVRLRPDVLTDTRGVIVLLLLNGISFLWGCTTTLTVYK